MFFCFLILISSLLLASPSFADESATAKDEATELETMTVNGQREKNLRERNENANKQSEILNGASLRNYGAHSLADAISQATGVNTQTFCANCGAKRVTIDGMRGEHTTLLIDGFPMHSTISAFYGVDAIPVVGLSGVEVSRGAGNVGLAPESIGGTINLLTVDALKNSFTLYSEMGDHGSSQSSFLGTAKKGDTAVVISGQKGVLDSWDIDGNGIAEFPYRKTQSLSLKLDQKISENSKISLRHSEANLLIVGGNTRHQIPDSYTRIQAQPSDFVDNDVSKEFIGDWSRITDVVRLNRFENSLLYTHDLSDSSLMKLRLSQVDQFQDANYSHGYDYRSHDRIHFANIELQKTFGNHILTLSLDGRKQRMKSQSDALFVNRQNPLTPDSLTFDSMSFGLMDEWRVNDRLSLELALRVEQIAIDWTDLNRKVEDTIAAPRLNAKYDHSDHISSRLSYGVGYRPPLTLFESEHGADHDGFLVEIDKLETADSYSYSLSANYPEWFITGTLHQTRLKNMAYAFDRVAKGQPMVFRNSDEIYNITAGDLFLGGKLWDALNLQVSYEHFLYPDAYTKKLPSAAFEQRVMIDLDYERDRYDFGLQASWIGKRNLSRYGYDEHYKVYDLDVASPTFGQVSQMKNQSAPAFWYANAHSKLQLSDLYAIAVRINNVLDFTQTGYGDSPTTWHYHLNHAHFDNFHTWGPLSGRELVVGLDGKW